jgi:histone H3/H4
MRFVLNAINREYLRNIVENGVKATERVDAAVAYVTKEDLLFDWCWQNKIPLRFWGRFDEDVPVAPRILRQFLTRASANYSCKLVRKFHAKVIWWHGLGAYVGSANLTGSAWYSNVEAGTFYEEAELEASGMDIELREFFRVLDQNGSPLTREICELLERRQGQLAKFKEADAKDAKDFLANPNVKPWEGLVHVTGKAGHERQRQEFLDEWNATLTLLRNLQDKVESYRPSWLREGIPAGAHVDQFLHAHYYNRVMDKGRSYFEEWHEKSRANPDQAEIEALEWWQQQSLPPSNEDRMLNEWAPFLRDMLAAQRLQELSEDDLAEIFKRVHAIADHARRIPNKDVDLPSTRQYSMDEKSNALAAKIFKERSQGGHSFAEVLDHILYGGSLADVPQRLWDGINEPQWKIDHIGRSALGELVGWALPNDFPPRNSRTSKALRSLGHDVTI